MCALSLRQAELEEEMMQLSLDTKGTKQELVDRLHAYLAAQEVSKRFRLCLQHSIGHGRLAY